MALKDLLNMTKTDRYTADGRDKINELQEKVTEDVTYKTGDSAPRELTGDCKIKIRQTQDVKYKTGDISQKTGLQKQPDGSWAPPKNGARKQKAAAGSEKPANIPSHQGMSAEDYDNKLRVEGWSNSGWESVPGNRAMGIFKKDGKTIRVMQNSDGKLASVEEIKPKAEAKPVAESKPTAMPKITENANKYIFSDLDNMSDEDKVFKALNAELDETFGDRDGYPGNVETWANNWLDHAMDEGGIGFKKSHRSEEPDAVVSGDDVMKIIEDNPERWARIIGNAKKFYSGRGTSTNFESDESYPIKLLGGKTVKGSEWTKGRSKRDYPLTGRDSAPRILTGDTKIRVRK